MALTEGNDLAGVLGAPRRLARKALPMWRLGPPKRPAGPSAARQAWLNRQRHRRNVRTTLRGYESEVWVEDGLSGTLKKMAKKAGKGLKKYGGAALAVAKFIPGVGSVVSAAESVAKPVQSAVKAKKKKISDARKAAGLPPISTATLEETAAAEVAAASRIGQPITPEQAVDRAAAALAKAVTPGSPVAAAESNAAAMEEARAKAEAAALKERVAKAREARPSALKKYGPWAAGAAVLLALFWFSGRKRT